MRKLWNRLTGNKCSHPHTLVATSVGVRRSVCAICGHISFKMLTRDRVVPPAGERPQLDEAAGL